MRKRVMCAVFLVPVLLAACASGPQYIDQTTIAHSYAMYMNKPLSSLILRIGPPTRNASAAGLKVYVWHATSFAYDDVQTCNLEVYVNDKSIIQGFAVRGQNAACQQFMLP